jgi:hypothetical protein
VTQADIDSGKPLASLHCEDLRFKAKTGRGKIEGYVCEMEAKDAGATSIFPTTARLVGQWRVAEDRAEWQAREKADALERQARNDNPVQEVLEPLLRRYKTLPFGAKAVMLHQVIRASTRLK